MSMKLNPLTKSYGEEISEHEAKPATKSYGEEISEHEAKLATKSYVEEKAGMKRINLSPSVIQSP